MGIEGWMVTLSIFILGLIWKVASSHFTLVRLEKNDEINKLRINSFEKTQIKMIEALDRTYATQKFVYELFITKDMHNNSVDRLEEKFVSELGHLNKTLDGLSDAIEALNRSQTLKGSL